MAINIDSHQWDQGEDIKVQVNQRALIDKILARYSGEYTIFRELLQNADDAGVSGNVMQVSELHERPKSLTKIDLIGSNG